MHPERKKLDKIGFVWDPFENDFKEGFSKLIKYKEREGHCLVPARYKEDGYKLGGWVSGKRKSMHKLSFERIKKLNSVGFVWDVKDKDWEKGFDKLLKFKEREGHCLTLYNHKEGNLILEAGL